VLGMTLKLKEMEEKIVLTFTIWLPSNQNQHNPEVNKLRDERIY
jgi:hypothetical protein